MINKIMDILILMTLLQMKHWYADFWIQTFSQTVRKGIYLDRVGISHSIDHVIGTLIALLIFSLGVHPLSPMTIIIMALVEGTVHYHIDWIKVKFGHKDMTNAIFWKEFGLDQFAHQATYLIMIWYLAFHDHLV